MNNAAEQQHEVLWPLGRTTSHRVPLAPRLPIGKALRIGFMWTWTFRGDEMFRLMQGGLLERFPGSTFVSHEAFGNVHGHDEAEVIEALPGRLRQQGIDALIVGVASAGSGTLAVLRAARCAEEAGVPAVALVGEGFVQLAKAATRSLGIPDLAIAQYPGTIGLEAEAEFQAKCRGALAEGVVRGLTEAPPAAEAAEEEPLPGTIVFRGTFDEVQRHFDEREWSDGLPFVPPTPERVAAFLEWTGRDPDEVIAVLPPEFREATVRSIAINGVMAGCLPEHMPILVAAVEAVGDPNFKLQHGGATPGWEPLITLSGELVDALRFNTGVGNMRAGRRANSAVGRFMRLYFRNVAGLRPDTLDKGSIGLNFNVAMAENEAAVREIGWQPFRADFGFGEADNVVSVRSVLAISMPVYSGGMDPETLAWPLARYLEGTLGPRVANGFLYAHQHPLIQMSPAVARAFARHGWHKAHIREFLFREARAPASWFEDYSLHETGKRMTFAEIAALCPLPAGYAESSADPERRLPVLVREEWTDILVAGDPQRNQSRIYINNHEHGTPVARRIILPPDWRKRLAKSR